MLQCLFAWLSDSIALLDALSDPGDDTALAQTLLAAASARCRAWPTLTSEQVHEVVRAVILKITIGSPSIASDLSKSALRALLLAVADHTFYEPEDNLIELSVEACLRRRGRAIRLLVSRGGIESQEDRSLIHTVAQAHQWLEQLLSGEVSSLRMIADAEGKSARYVSQVIRAAFLAPDLLEAVMEGRVRPAYAGTADEGPALGLERAVAPVRSCAGCKRTAQLPKSSIV